MAFEKEQLLNLDNEKLKRLSILLEKEYDDICSDLNVGSCKYKYQKIEFVLISKNDLDELIEQVKEKIS